MNKRRVLVYEKFPGDEKTYKLDRILIGEDDLPYLAGLFDGEGSICRSGNSLVFGFTNTDRLAVESFASAFGGYVTYRERKPYKDCWQWQLSNHDEMWEFLRWITPYLRIKRQQAELAWEWLVNKDKEYRKALLDNITELNHKGNHYVTAISYPGESTNE